MALLISTRTERAMQILGNGIYNYSEVAHILGLTAQRVSAWFTGWPSGTGPVLKRDYDGVLAEGNVLSFLDLIDTLVMSKLRDQSVSLQTIRKVYAGFAKHFKTEHPFSRQELLTDDQGKHIFLSAANDMGDEVLIDIIRRQHAFPQILKPYLNRIDYDPRTHFARVLHLNDSGVILDPRRRYGKPIIDSCGMPTAILADSYDANGEDVDAVAEWYNVDPSDVETAVEFERSYSGIAA